MKITMMRNPLQMLRKKGVFLFTLPLFFVLHGYVENYDFVPARDAGLLLLIYWGVIFGITILAWILFRNVIKAALFATALIALHFFFGSLHDFLKASWPAGFISKYSFLLPFLSALLIVLVIYLKKSRKPFHKLTLFLNVLFSILILFDLVLLATKASSGKQNTETLPLGFTECSDCERPDIYLILADEYASPRSLDEIFSFNDSAFISRLDSLGFRTLANSTSNYNYTPFALASILDMEYLQLSGTGRGKTDIAYCYRKIKHNRLVQFLRAHGYEFHNYSVFDFEGQPARTRETFLPANTRLITSQTLLSRIDRDIRFNLVTRFKSRRNQEIITYANRDNNEHLLALTKKIASDNTTDPKFVYTHLMMPHYPYYFDSAGREQPFETLQEGRQVDQKAYISYLQYTNRRLFDLVAHIRKVSRKPPLIILMGDHGFRHFTIPVERKHYFQNLLSVYGTGLERMPDSISGVNVFRAILNAKFGQQLPLLADSTIYLDD